MDGAVPKETGYLNVTRDMVYAGNLLFSSLPKYQDHPTDRFGGISVRNTCNRLKFSVREMSSRAFLINAFCFRRDKNDVLGTKIGQLGFRKGNKT